MNDVPTIEVQLNVFDRQPMVRNNDFILYI